MNKFTIFTIILVVSVITVTVDLAARDYFGNGVSAETSVLQSDDVENDKLSPQESAIREQAQVPKQTVETPDQNTPNSQVAVDTQKVEETPYTPPPASSVIKQDMISKAGFTGLLNEKHFDGKLFQLLDITKFPVEAMSFYEIQQGGSPVASITEIALRDEIRALQLYTLLQNKTKPYIDLSLNETNGYGDRSFYINHAKKTDEAFLTVKIGRMIYGFAYVKAFHPEIQKLIQLLIPQA
ncbi:MAG: hypothetical protein WCT53_02570 [Candidatus Gracilibacteria bacterium]